MSVSDLAESKNPGFRPVVALIEPKLENILIKILCKAACKAAILSLVIYKIMDYGRRRVSSIM